MSASAGPSCSPTLRTIASSSAAEAATAPSNRSISAGTCEGPARGCGSLDPKTESSR